MKINAEKVVETLVEELSRYLQGAGLKSMCLGISGGIDSTVVAGICRLVQTRTGIPLLGRSLTIKNKEGEISAARKVGEALCTAGNFKEIYLGDLFESVSGYITSQEAGYPSTPIGRGNIQARLRMIWMYNLAGETGGLVMSTDNQSEYQLGFWTLHGDVGDYDPLQALWKTEVYQVAEYLKELYEKSGNIKAAEAIADSIALTPTDGLGISGSDLDQIGASSYAEVDDILENLILAEEAEVPGEVWNYQWKQLTEKYGESCVQRVWSRHKASAHKRTKSPVHPRRGILIK
jgi:NAD+ synthetase